MADTIKCPSCGEDNPPGSTFCGGCGTKISQQTTHSSPSGFQAFPSSTPARSMVEESLRNARPSDGDDEEDYEDYSDEDEATPVVISSKPPPAPHKNVAPVAPVAQRTVAAPTRASQAPATAHAAMPPMAASVAPVLYEYQMVQVPPNIEVRGRSRGQEAAQYLQEVCNQHTAQGWEFYRVDTIGVLHSPGCLGSLLGQRSVAVDYYVVTFRRPRR